MAQKQVKQDYSEGSGSFSESSLRLYNMIIMIRKSGMVSEVTYIILKFIQIVQIMSLLSDTQYFKQATNQISRQILIVFSYINLNSFVSQSHNNNQILVILGTAVAILMIVPLLFLIAYCLHEPHIMSKSRALLVISKAINGMYFLFKTILVIPFLNIIISSLIFAFSGSIQNLIQIMSISLAILTLVLLILLQLAFTLLYPPCSPFYSHPQACLSIKKYYITFIIISLLTFLCKLNGIIYDINYSIPFVVFIGLTWLIEQTQWKYLYGFRSDQLHYTTKVNKIYTFTALMVGIFLMMYSLFKDQWVEQIWVYFLIIEALYISYTFLSEKNTISELADFRYNDINCYYRIVGVMEGINHITTAFQSKVLVEGFIQSHIKDCNAPGSNCVCKQLASRKSISNFEIKKIYYKFIAQLLQNNVHKTQNPQNFYILLSEIYFDKLKNRFQAIIYLAKALKYSNDSVYIRIRYSELMKVIQQVMVKDDRHNMNMYQNSSVDIGSFLEFNTRLIKFEENVIQNSIKHFFFWKQILDRRVDLEHLNTMGNDIILQKQNIEKEYKQLRKQNPQNKKLLQIYARYLIYVCQDQQDSAFVLQQMATMNSTNEQFSSPKTLISQKYSSNAKTSIVIISGNEHNLGTILQVNQETTQLTGFEKKDILQQSVNAIMPKFYAENHDLVLQTYLKTSNQRLNNVERIVPMLTSQRYIIPILALTKAIPDLSEGIRIVGFLAELSKYDHFEIQENGSETIEKPTEQDHKNLGYILYECNTETVIGISKQCSKQLFIPRCLIYGDKDNSSNMNEFKMKNIFGVNIQKIQENAIANEELILNLDTTKISNEFILANNQLFQSNKKVSKEKMGTSKKVVAKSILASIYYGVPVRMIRIRDFKEAKTQYEISGTGSYQREDIKVKQSNEFSVEPARAQNHILNEFNQLTSVKTQSSNIKIVDCFCTIFLFLIMASTGIQLGTYQQIHNLRLQLLSSVEKSFKNRLYLSELLFQAQKIYVRSNERFQEFEKFNLTEIKQKIDDIWPLTQKNSLKLLSYKNIHGFSKLNTTDYLLNVDGSEEQGINSFKQEQIPLDYSIMSWLSKVRNVRYGNEGYLHKNPLDFQSLIVNNYMQVKYVGVFSHIEGNIQIQNEMLLKHKEFIEIYLIIKYSVLAFMISMMILFLLVSVPKTFSLLSINHKVLSLFKMISNQTVNNIIQKCLEFNTMYSKDYLKENPYFIKQFKQLKNEGSKVKKNSGYQDSGVDKMETSSGLIFPKSTTENKKIEKPISSQMSNFDDSEQQRGEFMGKKKKVILIYLFISLFVLAFNSYSLMIELVEAEEDYENIQKLQILVNRVATFNEIKTTQIQYMLNPVLATNDQNISSLNDHMIDLIYKNENDLVNLIEKTTLFNEIPLYNNENICLNISQYQDMSLYSFDTNKLNIDQCQGVDEGLLTKGVKTIIVHELQKLRALMAGHDDSDLFSQIARKETVSKYVMAAMWKSAQLSYTILFETISKKNTLFYVANGIKVVIAFLFWQIAWKRFKKELNQSIWNTKGMLNIIPTKVIEKQELLMNYICSEEFEKGVS